MLSEKNTQFNFVAHQIDFFMCVCVWLIIIIIFSLGKSLKPTFFLWLSLMQMQELNIVNG